MLHILTQKPAAYDLYGALVSGLEIEFKTPDVELLAAHFLDAERDDFHWESRFDERHLGAYESLDDEPEELDRLAIIGYRKGRWHTAICIVDRSEERREGKEWVRT